MEHNYDKIADQWLDKALKQYGEAEPRTGLETRILANLPAAREESPGRRRWWPALAGAAAILVAGSGIFLGIEHHAAKKEIATVEAPAITQAHSSAPSNHRLASTLASTDRIQRKLLSRRQSVQAADVAEPRLEQFPAPRPLSEQEEMLARYVEGSPQEARQAGLAQAALLKKDLAEFEKEYGPLDHPNSYSQ